MRRRENTRRRRADGRSETIYEWFKILLVVSSLGLAVASAGVDGATGCRRDADGVVEAARRRLGLPPVTPGASTANDAAHDARAVKRAFRIAALRYHPDKSRAMRDEGGGWTVEDAEREFQSLVDAYETVLTSTTTTTTTWTSFTTCKEDETERRRGVWDGMVDVAAGWWKRTVTRAKNVGGKVWATESSASRRRFVAASKTNEDEQEGDEDASETSSKTTTTTTTTTIRFRGNDGSTRDEASDTAIDDTDAAEDAYRFATRAFWARAKALLDDDTDDDDEDVLDNVRIDDEYPARFRSRV